MFKQRIHALGSQNIAAVRVLWQGFGDERNSGVITDSQFVSAVNSLGAGMSRQEAANLRRIFTRRDTGITFAEFFHGLCALPEHYFSRELSGIDQINPLLLQQQGPQLPPTTTLAVLDQRFRKGARIAVFDVKAALSRVMRQPGACRLMDKNHLWNILSECNLLLGGAELTTLFNSYDHNGDGFLDYKEFVRELLDLPATKEHRRCPKIKTHVNMSSTPYANLLRRNCERAAAPPARLMSFFAKYDTDGSGQISYDEMRFMVRDFNCQAEGRDAAALLLDKYSNGKGSMKYLDFVTRVLLLPVDSLRASVGCTRPATAEVTSTISQNMRRKVLELPGGQQRLFKTFAPLEGAKSVRQAQFVDCVASFGLPITKSDSKALFRGLDTKDKGRLSKDEFLASCLMNTPRIPEKPSRLRSVTPAMTHRGTPRRLPSTFSKRGSHQRLDSVRNTF